MATRYGNDGEFHAAASKVMMRPGRHFVQFTVAEGIGMIFGAILLRPSWDVQGGERAEDEEATASTTRTAGNATPATATGRAGTARGSRATSSVCCSTSTRFIMTVCSNDRSAG